MSRAGPSTDHLVNANDTDDQPIVSLQTIHNEDPPEQPPEDPGHFVTDADNDQESIVSMETVHKEGSSVHTLPHIPPPGADPGPLLSEKSTFGACFIFLILAICFSQPLLTTSLSDFAPNVFKETSYAELRWAEQAWTATATAVGPLYGRLSYHYGRRKLILIAVFIFLVGQALATLSAGRFYLMIIMRGIAGLGGGGIFPLAFISCADLYQDQARRAQQTAPWALVYTVSSLVVPYLGVAIVRISDMAMWQWLFYIPLILGFIGLVFAFFLPRKLRTEHLDALIDWWGMLSLIFSITFIITGLAWSSYSGIEPTSVSSQSTTAVTSSFSLLPATSTSLPTPTFSSIQVSTPTATLISHEKRRWRWWWGDDDCDDDDDDDSLDNSTSTTSVSTPILNITTGMKVPVTTSLPISTPTSTSSISTSTPTNKPGGIFVSLLNNSMPNSANDKLQCSVFVPSADPNGVDGGLGISQSAWIAVLVLLFALGSGLLVLFAGIENRDANTTETIPLKVFTDWTLLVIFAVETLFGIVFSIIQHFLPIYFGSQASNCEGGTATALNILPPLIGAGLATAIFTRVMSHWQLHHIFSLTSSVLMLIGVAIIAATTSNPTTDTHIADGVALFIASVAVVIAFQILVLWAQYQCEKIIQEEKEKSAHKEKKAGSDEKGPSNETSSSCSRDDDKDGMLNIVTGLTQAFWQLGTALGYTLSNLVFTSKLTHIFYEYKLDSTLAQQIASLRAIPKGEATDATVAAYGQSLRLVYMSLCLPIAILSVVILLGYWIWLRYYPKVNGDAEARNILNDTF